jgi:hypothetical protein
LLALQRTHIGSKGGARLLRDLELGVGAVALELEKGRFLLSGLQALCELRNGLLELDDTRDVAIASRGLGGLGLGALLALLTLGRLEKCEMANGEKCA